MFGLFKQKFDGPKTTELLAQAVVDLYSSTPHTLESELPSAAGIVRGGSFRRELLALIMFTATEPFTHGPLGERKGGEFTRRIVTHAMLTADFPLEGVDAAKVARDAVTVGLSGIGRNNRPPSDNPDLRKLIEKSERESKIITEFVFTRLTQYHAEAVKATSHKELVMLICEAFFAHAGVGDFELKKRLVVTINELVNSLMETSHKVALTAKESKVVW